jgi:excisionase family DNA binding protein
MNRIESSNRQHLYSVEDIAYILQLTQREVYNLIYEGKLKAAKVERLWRISSRDLERYLSECGFNEESIKQNYGGETAGNNEPLVTSNTTKKEMQI